jgi:nitrite reductase/ring-hydroxylating ferredoxin subunit
VSARVFVDVSDLASGTLRAIEAHGRRLVLCRTEDGVYALENRCPHAFVPLDAGRLHGHVLECPLHGGRLDVRDGSPCAAPIRKPAIRYAVRAVAGGIEIDLGPAPETPRREACTT